MRTMLPAALPAVSLAALATAQQSRDFVGLAIAIVEEARRDIGYGPNATYPPLASGPFYIDGQSFVDKFDWITRGRGTEIRDTLIKLGYPSVSLKDLVRQDVDSLGLPRYWSAQGPRVFQCIPDEAATSPRGSAVCSGHARRRAARSTTRCRSGLGNGLARSYPAWGTAWSSWIPACESGSGAVRARVRGPRPSGARSSASVLPRQLCPARTAAAARCERPTATGCSSIASVGPFTGRRCR